MDSKKFKIILVIVLISSVPLTLLQSRDVFAREFTSNNQFYFKNGVGSYFETFNDTTYKSGVTTAWGWGGGQLTNERNFSYIVQDNYATSDICKGIDIQGRKAYIVVDHPTATDSLEILDITSPAFITQMSSRSSYPEMISIAIHGDYLYAGTNMSWQDINVYNATDPLGLANPSSYLANVNTDGAVTDIEPWGHLIYFTNYDSASDKSLGVLDASDPANPNLIYNTWSTNKSYGLDINGQIAYMAASDEGFYVLNISDKYSAIEYDYLSVPGFASDVLVDGRFAYLAAGEAGVHVIDIFNPQNVILVGTIDTNGFARKLVKQGNTLFVACLEGGLYTLDVVDPFNPSYVSYMVFGGDRVWDVDTFGNYVFVATDSGVTSILASATGGGLMDFGVNAYRSRFDDFLCYDVQVHGDVAYCAGGTDGFYTVNVRDPINPILLDHYPAPFINFKNLDVEGQYAYLVDINDVWIFDITDPSNILLHAKESGLNLNDIDVEGELMYLSFGAGVGGYGTLNNSDPSNPDFQSNIWFGVNITSLDMQGHHIYAVDHTASGAIDDTVFCYDLIPDVFNPDYLGVEDLISYCTDIFVDGDLAYVSDSNWLVVEDITDPTNPTYLLSIDWGSAGNFVHSFGVRTFGTNIINAGGDEGVHFLDYIDITPTYCDGTNYPDATAAFKVDTHGDYTYVANQTSLIILRHFESPGDTYVAGNYLGESLAVNPVTTDLIRTATLNVVDFIPDGTFVDYFLSADGGANWEPVIPGIEHEFANPGSELQWRAEFVGPKDRSVHIYELSIDYFVNEAPSIPLLTDPGDLITTSSVTIEWTASIDDAGIDHYELQLDDQNSFATPLDEFNATGTSALVTGLTNGTYYFRVRAVDVWDLASDWSTIVDLEVQITSLDLEWWVYVAVGGGLVLIIVTIVLVSRARKRKKAVTR